MSRAFRMNALILCAALCSGYYLSTVFPFPVTDLIPMLVSRRIPNVYRFLFYSWYFLLFSSSFILLWYLRSIAFIFLPSRVGVRGGKLPKFPAVKDSESLSLVVGEVHHPRTGEPVEKPYWLKLPVLGLYTGTIVFGAIGSGKTSSALRPFATQLLGWRAHDKDHKVGGIVLEVKGDFCHQVKAILEQAGRGDDYVELGMETEYRYNPLYNDMDAFSKAYSIAMVLTQLFGRSKDSFWPSAYTNLVKFIIVLHEVVDDYVTLLDVYLSMIDPERLRRKIEEGEQKFARMAAAQTYLVIDPMVYLAHEELAAWKWRTVADGMYQTPQKDDLLELLDRMNAPYRIVAPEITEDEEALAVRLNGFAAVRRWFDHDWMRMDTKLRTSVVEGISIYLSLFDENLKVKRIFCPPKEYYTGKAEGMPGKVLPPISELIEAGKVLALNFPMSGNPAISRFLGCLLKNDYQRAMLNRIPKMARAPEEVWRDSLFIIDEYHQIATVGESDPNGDEKFFALSRQARCIPIVATQSISSLRSAVHGESWRTLLQSFRTKIFLAAGDQFTAKEASEYCGREKILTPTYSMSESGGKTRTSLLTGHTVSGGDTGINLSKSWGQHMYHMFDPVAFMTLRTAQAIVSGFDGVNQLAPMRVMLKPWFMDRNKSYFEQYPED